MNSHHDKLSVGLIAQLCITVMINHVSPQFKYVIFELVDYKFVVASQLLDIVIIFGSSPSFKNYCTSHAF